MLDGQKTTLKNLNSNVLKNILVTSIRHSAVPSNIVRNRF